MPHARRFSCFIRLGVLVGAIAIALRLVAAHASPVTFTLLTVNDVYELAPVKGHGGLAELMTLLNAERATTSHHLTTVNGDFLSPSVMSALFKGAQMIDAFNALGVDVVVFGNHEFDFGPDITRQRMAESTFVWLGTNVLEAEGKPFGQAHSTLLRQVDTVTVGLFGLLTPEAAILSSAGAGVTFAPLVPTAHTAVETLRNAGADVIIALTHLSIAEDRELARQVPGIHLILGGHDHDPITWYEGNTLIHKSGYDAHYLGRIDLIIDKHSTAQGSQVTVTPTWRMIANRNTIPDPVVAAKVAQYTAQLDTELAQPLGQSQTALDSQRGAVRTAETTMGNLIADVLREVLHADVALVNGGGIRGDRLYDAGVILTRGDVLRELPFSNVGILLEILGADLLQALENGVSQVEAKAGRFPQVSGLRMLYNPHKPPGSRVVQVTINSQPIDPAAHYRVATSDYLLKGGDGYASLRTGTLLIDPRGGPLLATMVMQYIAARSPVAPQVEGRIMAQEAP
jgi:2',3'-cyclic-nucleotide 2'-phosphodiesterase (5'-nucleotidase family)